MALLPPINQHVELRDTSGRSHATRVEAVDGGLVTVSRPSDLQVTGDFTRGVAFDVLWATGSGVHALPVQLLTTQKDGAVIVWILQPIGDTVREQRRNFVRLSLGIPMSLVITKPKSEEELSPEEAAIAAAEAALLGTTDEPEPEVVVPVKATLADVSEAALRTHLAVVDGDLLKDGAAVRVGFTIDQTAFALDGKVLRTRKVEGRTEDEREATEAIILFDTDEQVASQLRRAVFAEQIRLRNLSPDR